MGKNINEVITTKLADINTPRVLFIPVHELDIIDPAGGEATPTETPPDNGETPPLLTQPPSTF